jgi:hypothetical protein
LIDGRRTDVADAAFRRPHDSIPLYFSAPADGIGTAAKKTSARPASGQTMPVCAATTLAWLAEGTARTGHAYANGNLTVDRKLIAFQLIRAAPDDLAVVR